MMEVVAHQIPFSLSYKCFVNLRYFILVIVKQYILFKHFFCLSISLEGLIWLVITISPFYFLFFNTKIVGMLKDMKKRKMCGVIFGN